MWTLIDEEISRALGETFTTLHRRSLGGGCINEAFHLEGRSRSLFVKLNSAARLAMFTAEAAGLEAIRASKALRAPRPIAWGTAGQRSWLALEFIPFSASGHRGGAPAGEQLAAMHRSSAQAFGWERNNTIGATPQPNPWTADWAGFFRDQRLGYQLRLARENGLPEGSLERLQRLLEVVPVLLKNHRPIPSLLHGDLWGGNWGVASDGRPVVFDPAVYYGDREAELAMTELFGGFDSDFYQAYRHAWPPEPGYQTRKDLYNLYHILNHFNLFGAGYASQAAALAEQLLSETR